MVCNLVASLLPPIIDKCSFLQVCRIFTIEDDFTDFFGDKFVKDLLKTFNYQTFSPVYGF